MLPVLLGVPLSFIPSHGTSTVQLAHLSGPSCSAPCAGSSSDLLPDPARGPSLSVIACLAPGTCLSPLGTLPGDLHCRLGPCPAPSVRCPLLRTSHRLSTAMPVDPGMSREQVTWRNSSGWAVSCPAARKLLRSSCWASVSLAISSAWRTSEALTRSLPRWTNSAIETKQGTLQVACLAKPPLTASSSTWSVRNAGVSLVSYFHFII